MGKKAKAKGKKAKGKDGDEHGKKDISKQLANLNEVWGDIPEASFEDVPDGKQQIQIKAATLNVAKSESKRFQCSWTLKVVSGEYANRNVFKHDGLDTEESIGYFKSGLARLGVEYPDDANDLPEVLEELLDTFASVTLRTKAGREIQNIFFDRALDSDDIDDVPEEAAATGDDTSDDWKKDDKCQVDIDGEMYSGIVAELHDDGETALIKFDDGDKDTYSLDDLIEIETEDAEPEDTKTEDAEPEDEDWKKDDRCQVDIEGEMWPGVIKSIKDDKAKIKFDDGDEDTYPLDDLIEIKDESTGKTKDKDSGDEAPGKITLNFDEDGIKKRQHASIEKLAKKHEFNPDDYETYKDLLIDITEYLELDGEYSDSKSLINALEEDSN